MEARVFLKGCVSVALVGIALSLAAVAYAADPTKEECIASSERGQELRSATKLSDARAQFGICVSTRCPGPIREDCVQRLDEIATVMPSIIFQVKDSSGNDVPGVTIMMDGQPLAASAGTAMEVDPGEHAFTFEAQRKPKIETRLVLVEGARWSSWIALARHRPRAPHHHRRAKRPHDGRIRQLSLG
jgi:hypothetical protein